MPGAPLLDRTRFHAALRLSGARTRSIRFSTRESPFFPSWRHSPLPRRQAVSAWMSSTRSELPSSVRPFAASSVPVSSLSGPMAVPGSLFTTTASADFPPGFPDGISPGKNTLLPCTTASFTVATKPLDFAVLCQLVPSLRPCMKFLFISLQVSSSLPPPGRLPFRSWLQLVISFSCFHLSVLSQGTLTPFTTCPCWAHTRRSSQRSTARLFQGRRGMIKSQTCQCHTPPPVDRSSSLRWISERYFLL